MNATTSLMMSLMILEVSSILKESYTTYDQMHEK